MKYYTVIDTNVLVSAMLKHHSVPGSIKMSLEKFQTFKRAGGIFKT